LWSVVNCRSCGNQIYSTATYCQHCGTPLRFRAQKRPARSRALGVALVAMIVLSAVLAAALVAAVAENARLGGEYAGFDRTKEDLLDEIGALERDKADLQDQVGLLQDDIDDLESIIASMQGDTGDLEDEISAWWYIYNLRAGDHPADMVTPDEPDVFMTSAQILASDADGELTWDDMYAINDWVHANIVYSADPQITNPHGNGQWDYWQTPAETLERGEGDCEDFANLALSLMLAEEEVPWLFGATVLFSGGGGHVGIFVNVENDQMSVLDPTWGWWSPSSTAETLALEEWANQEGYNGVSWVVNAYSPMGVEEFDTMQEFYNWF
jgi:predicted transglutaminase-like cysteine proteinase